MVTQQLEIESHKKKNLYDEERRAIFKFHEAYNLWLTEIRNLSIHSPTFVQDTVKISEAYYNFVNAESGMMLLMKLDELLLLEISSLKDLTTAYENHQYISQMDVQNFKTHPLGFSEFIAENTKKVERYWQQIDYQRNKVRDTLRQLIRN